MPRPKSKDNMYFGEEQEYAVKMFLTATTLTERNQIYTSYLYAPLNKMIDSIIRRYKLYRKGLEFRDIHADVLSFLITKAEKFQPAKGKKAYSYFGTICKNYLMGQIIKDQKLQNRSVSYEDISKSIEERPDQVYYMNNGEETDTTRFFIHLVDEIEEFMSVTPLNENEVKVGSALIEVFTNYDEIFIHGEGNKFNKNLVLLNLREMTNLSTKEIRSSLKKFKIIYKGVMDGYKD
tara:strand:+ start:3267 stop:3971 length:705 start_codon:yes stop_codon:yes gene_type:complete